MARFISSFKAWQYTTRCTIYNNLRNVRLFRVKQFFNLWRKNEKFPVTKKIKVIFSDDVVFYEKGLKTKAMVCLFRQHLLGIKAKNFFVKTTLVKFFTQNWLSAMRKKQLLRKVLTRSVELNSKLKCTRYQHQYDLLVSVIYQWKACVDEKKFMYLNLASLEFYRRTLLIKGMKYFKLAKRKTIACSKLIAAVLN